MYSENGNESIKTLLAFES